MAAVKIVTGTVMHGQIIVEGEPFSEGETVTILGHEDRETFSVLAQEKRLLLMSMAEADRGEFVDADELLTDLNDSN
jgi:redox-sensitive bicupin YhaK (pirin superfamily)